MILAVIKDVAKLANVSVGTVSNYLNKPEKLKESTKAKVQAAIDALNFHANPFASNIRTGKSNSIAVIMPNITNPFYAELYNSVKLQAMTNGFTTILYTTEDDLDLLKDYFINEKAFHVDGAILCYIDEDMEILDLISNLQTQIPITLITYDINYSKNSSIAIDTFQGVYKATSYIISLGHKKIAYLGGPKTARRAIEKFNGFARALSDANLELIDNYVFSCSYDMHSGYRAVRELFMQSSELPTAVIAANDILAIGALKFFLHSKIEVPDKIAIIGFDNILLARMYEPSISTIEVPIKEMGMQAVNLLISKMQNPNSKNKQIIMPSNLIVRNSTEKDMPLEFEFDQ